MALDPLTIAQQGIQTTSVYIALQGLWDGTSPVPPVPPSPVLGGGSGGGKKKRKQPYRETHVAYLGKTAEDRPNTLESDLRKAFNSAFNLPDEAPAEAIRAARLITEIAKPNLLNPKRPVIDLAAVMARGESTRRILEINATLQNLLGLKAEADRVLEARTQAIAAEANAALKRMMDDDDDSEIILLLQPSI